MQTTHSPQMVSIGTLAKTCGVTRRMLLNYEDHGLLLPVFIAPNSGYRYYDAASVTCVCQILELQRAGFSLLEIRRSFAGDRSVVRQHLERLKNTQRMIAGQISTAEAYLSPADDRSVFLDTFPAFDAVCIRSPFDSGETPEALLRQAVSSVLRHGWQISELVRQQLLLVHLSRAGMPAQVTALCAVQTPNPDSVFFPEERVLRTHATLSYAALPAACEALLRAAPDFRVHPSGDVRVAMLPPPGSASAEPASTLFIQLFLPVTDAPFHGP